MATRSGVYFVPTMQMTREDLVRPAVRTPDQRRSSPGRSRWSIGAASSSAEAVLDGFDQTTGGE